MLLYGIIQSMKRNPREKSRRRGKILILFNMSDFSVGNILVTVKQVMQFCSCVASHMS